MSNEYVSWAKDAAERAVATAAEVLVVFLGADVVDVLSVDWRAAFGIAAGGFVTSFLKSLAARNIRNPEDASLVK